MDNSSTATCVAVVRDAPLDIWGGGARVFFTSERKRSFFLAGDQSPTIFFFMFRRRNFLSYAFPIMYVTIWCFFWSTYLSSISTTNFFSAHIFNKLFFWTFLATNYFFQFFSRSPPPQNSNGASLKPKFSINYFGSVIECW